MLLENNIRGGVSDTMGDMQVVSDINKEILLIEAKNLNGWAMSHNLPIGE